MISAEPVGGHRHKAIAMQTKTIGLLGGIGWASSAEYYRILNEMVAAREGDAHSARLILHSMDQHDFTSRAANTDPQAIIDFLATQVAQLKAGGADGFLLCANGAHRFAPALLPLIDLPFISIVDATARAVSASSVRKVGLLGVRQTMAGRFYHERLEASGIEVLTPSPAEQDIIHAIIYSELVQNRITEASRRVFVELISKLAQQGAEGCILGCTEIPLLIKQTDVAIPVFDTMAIHCRAALDFAFSA
jgi:aspartate racemase